MVRGIDIHIAWRVRLLLLQGSGLQSFVQGDGEYAERERGLSVQRLRGSNPFHCW
jgi:hypothetical protein